MRDVLNHCATVKARKRRFAIDLPVAVNEPSIVKQWTFLNNHAHVLICLARNPDAVLREVASNVGITERAVQLIVSDLEGCGTLIRKKIGRCNTYIINPNHPLRHPLENRHTIEELLTVLLSAEELTKLKLRWEAENH